MRILRTTAMVVLLACGMGGPVEAAQSCVGFLPPGSHAGINVPAGGYCALGPGAVIKGNVEVRGYLRAEGVAIEGNLTAREPSVISLVGSRVAGNVEIAGGWSHVVADNRIRGNVAVKQTRGTTLFSNVVNGNLEVEGNLAQVVINGNRIRGNLHCTNNLVPPAALGNAVGGSLSGQCALF